MTIAAGTVIQCPVPGFRRASSPLLLPQPPARAQSPHGYWPKLPRGFRPGSDSQVGRGSSPTTLLRFAAAGFWLARSRPFPDLTLARRLQGGLAANQLHGDQARPTPPHPPGFHCPNANTSSARPCCSTRSVTGASIRIALPKPKSQRRSAMPPPKIQLGRSISTGWGWLSVGGLGSRVWAIAGWIHPGSAPIELRARSFCAGCLASRI